MEFVVQAKGSWLLGGQTKTVLQYNRPPDGDGKVILPEELTHSVYIHGNGLDEQTLLISGEKNGKFRIISIDVDLAAGPMNVRIVKEYPEETIARLCEYLAKVIEANFDITEEVRT